MKKSKKIRFFFEYLFFSSSAKISSFLPRKVVLILGGLFGRTAYLLDRKRKRTGLANLELAFGDSLSEKQRKNIIRRAYIQIGKSAVDVFLFPRFTDKAIGKTILYEGLEHIKGAYASKRGVFLFSAHFGNWELVAHMQGHLGLPLNLVTRPLDNPYIEQLAKKYRTLSGNSVIYKKEAVRGMLKSISDGQGVAIVIDQNVREKPNIFVDFFGHLASTTPSLALLALKTKAAIIPVFSILRDDGTYRIIYEKEVELPSTGDRQQDVQELTQKCTSLIEEYVRQYPHLWMWMHQRWKTKPTQTQ
jgi:KDO2-lipid IV(A) lauroyltransferase